MAQKCFQNEYFDNLLYACKPCHLRCSNTPPLVCQSYCYASNTSTLKITDVSLWICLGVGIISSLTIFLLILLKKKNPKRSKDELENTEPKTEVQEITKFDLDRSKYDEAGILPRNSTTMPYIIEECKCKDCNLDKGDIASDICFPLPAMEEGATVLVTTKTNDFCKSSSGPMNDTFMGIWKSIFTT
ncbi:tumor necrosis factor receptor superfamily member 17 isoform X1 [Sarcophilus harrisii]|uniref:TNF receptor superfamily member 17 n=1 Tax=Sarcophilus harrisii TaxID=9305 RepID=A0A7N4NRJ0_SARHA|nr:tumor necrosis factor receptor superfamily member 17 isoform X1 [Sarcophilus harrisii]